MHWRVCGLLLEDPPWGSNGDEPSWDICPCCGVEFGYEDIDRESVARYRKQWIESGRRWFAPKSRPASWQPDVQMRSVPDEFAQRPAPPNGTDHS